MSNIEIYWDEQQPGDGGWAYRVDNDESGPIVAARTVDAIVDFEEGWDVDALAQDIGYREGDEVAIVGPGLPGRITPIFERVYD